MEPLVYYIKENIKKYSESQLRDVLLQEGYSSQEMDRAFQDAKKSELPKESFGFFMAILLALSFGVFVFIRPVIGLILIVLTFNNQLVAYGLVLASGLFLGWLCSAVMQKTTKKAGLRVFAGIMVSAIPTELMMIIFSLVGFIGNITGFLSQVGAGSMPPERIISAFPSIMPNEILVISLMFFVSFNLPFFIGAAKEQKKSFLILYLLAPIVFIGTWYLVKIGLSILTGVLGGAVPPAA